MNPHVKFTEVPVTDEEMLVASKQRNRRMAANLIRANVKELVLVLPDHACASLAQSEQEISEARQMVRQAEQGARDYIKSLFQVKS